MGGYIFISMLAIVLFLVVVYFILFYPRQSMPVGLPVEIKTPDYEKYRND